MKLKLLFLTAVLVTALYTIIRSQEQKLIVAVVDFENKTGEASNDAYLKSISGILTSELIKTGKYRLIERNRFDKVLDELKLSMTGLIDPDKTKEAGKLLGVDAFVFGNLSSIKYSKNKQTIVLFYRVGQKTELSMDARVVDVETGEIIKTANITANAGQSQWVAFFAAKIGKITDEASMISKGIEEGCKSLAKELSLR